MQADIKQFLNFKEIYNEKDMFQKIVLPCGETKGRDDIRKLMDNIPVSFKGKTVLDIGCNCGAWCFEVLHRGAEKAFGIDKDVEAILFANLLRQLFGYKNSGFCKANFSEVKWDDMAEADIVFVNQVLYRFTEGEGALDLIVKKCREYLMMYTFTLETVDTPDADNVYWIPTLEQLLGKLRQLDFKCTFMGNVDAGTGKRQFIFRRVNAT